MVICADGPGEVEHDHDGTGGDDRGDDEHAPANLYAQAE
jgi:hypothetical protein